MSLDALVDGLRHSRGFAHKRDIAGVMEAFASHLPGGAAAMGQAVGNGDDCAAVAIDDGYLLLAIEGMTEDFIERMPWFAGYSAVMVNISDVAAMGGRPLAVVDALWSQGMDPASEVIAGMCAASAAYGVPIVGGHSNNRAARGQLAVAILGRATRLLSSFAARPGDRLVMAVDLRGRFEDPFPWWNASTGAPPQRLRADIGLLATVAEEGLCAAAKDISMAGAVGTALMMLECSGAGARIALDAIPRPPEVPLARWLTAFPSFGFVLSVPPRHADALVARFQARDIACAVVGEVTASRTVHLSLGEETRLLWDLADDTFIGAAPAQAA